MKKGELASIYWRVYDDTDVEIADTEQEATDKYGLVEYGVVRLTDGAVIWFDNNDSCYINNYAGQAIVWEDGEEPCYDDGTPIDWGDELNYL